MQDHKKNVIRQYAIENQIMSSALAALMQYLIELKFDRHIISQCHTYCLHFHEYRMHKMFAWI